MPTWKPGYIDCLGIRSALGSVARLSSPLLWDPWNGKQSKHFTCQAMASTTLHHLSLTYISTFFLNCKHFHSTTLSCSPLPNLMAFGLQALVHISHHVNISLTPFSTSFIHSNWKGKFKCHFLCAAFSDSHVSDICQLWAPASSHTASSHSALGPILHNFSLQLNYKFPEAWGHVLDNFVATIRPSTSAFT